MAVSSTLASAARGLTLFGQAWRGYLISSLKKDVIRMIVPPLEIFVLLGGFSVFELAISAMMLVQINAIGAIFLVVPRVVVMAVAIVVALVTMFVRRRVCGRNHHCARENRTQNQESMHVVNLSFTGYAANLSKYLAVRRFFPIADDPIRSDDRARSVHAPIAAVTAAVRRGIHGFRIKGTKMP